MQQFLKRSLIAVSFAGLIAAPMTSMGADTPTKGAPGTANGDSSVPGMHGSGGQGAGDGAAAGVKGPTGAVDPNDKSPSARAIEVPGPGGDRGGSGPEKHNGTAH